MDEIAFEPSEATGNEFSGMARVRRVMIVGKVCGELVNNMDFLLTGIFCWVFGSIDRSILGDFRYSLC